MENFVENERNLLHSNFVCRSEKFRKSSLQLSNFHAYKILMHHVKTCRNCQAIPCKTSMQAQLGHFLNSFLLSFHFENGLFNAQYLVSYFTDSSAFFAEALGQDFDLSYKFWLRQFFQIFFYNFQVFQRFSSTSRL